MKAIPLNIVCSSTGSRLAMTRSIAMPTITIADDSHSAAPAANARLGLTAKQRAAERGAGHDCGLRRRVGRRNGARQHPRRNDIGQHRLQARLFEGAPGADHERHGEQQRWRQPSARRRRGENRDRQRLDGLRVAVTQRRS